MARARATTMAMVDGDNRGDSNAPLTIKTS